MRSKNKQATDADRKRMTQVAIDELEELMGSTDGWCAIFDHRFDAVGATCNGDSFEWKGKRWEIVRIAPAPCGCKGMRLAFVRVVGSGLRVWSSVRCPTGHHANETFHVEIAL